MNFITGFMYLVAIATAVKSCSIPDGGFVEPTPSDIVRYSSHVVVGEVTEITGDPIYQDMYGNSTYGAMVTVHCFYKGGTVPESIQIGGAGFVPGLCFAKPLEKGKHYVIFLSHRYENSDAYEQSETAEPLSKFEDFLTVCGLSRDYPKGNGMMLKEQQFCPDVKPAPDCPSNANTGSDVTPDTGATKKAAGGTPPPNLKDDESGTVSHIQDPNDGNGASVLSTSFVSFVMFLTCTKFLM
ncbi:hypothetical protein ACF0H5_013947 [Mactra antiquata]